ncbi:hypothetical protein XAR_3576 [Xanthomonas citri pv. glycines str. 8ra]|nr:hypothetical protein XAR_3576 [Xanthomonas citri pv. glycines str. 8ra]
MPYDTTLQSNDCQERQSVIGSRGWRASRLLGRRLVIGWNQAPRCIASAAIFMVFGIALAVLFARLAGLVA